jgi:hypothetical protein
MEYSCEPCGYTTRIKADHRRHLETKKHKTNVQANEVESCVNVCTICAKEYASRGGLWKHKKQIHSHAIEQDIVDDKINEVKNECNEKIELMTKMMTTIMSIVEQLKQPQAQITGDNNVNANNNNTTVLMMLNTNHSHVMSIDTFIKNMEVSLERTLSSLDRDISELTKDIFMDNLAGISPEDRPIHCSDAKRNTYYVKGSEEWVKDQGEKLVKAIQAIHKLKINKLMDWCKENLNEIKNNDQIGQEYMTMLKNISGPEDEHEIARIKSQTIKLINEIIPLKDIK